MNYQFVDKIKDTSKQVVNFVDQIGESTDSKTIIELTKEEKEKLGLIQKAWNFVEKGIRFIGLGNLLDWFKGLGKYIKFAIKSLVLLFLGGWTLYFIVKIFRYFNIWTNYLAMILSELRILSNSLLSFLNMIGIYCLEYWYIIVIILIIWLLWRFYNKDNLKDVEDLIEIFNPIKSNSEIEIQETWNLVDLDNDDDNNIIDSRDFLETIKSNLVSIFWRFYNLAKEYPEYTIVFILGILVFIGEIFSSSDENDPIGLQLQNLQRSRNSINIELLQLLDQVKTDYDTQYSSNLYTQELQAFHENLAYLRSHIDEFNKDSLNLRLVNLKKDFQNIINIKNLQLQVTLDQLTGNCVRDRLMKELGIPSYMYSVLRTMPTIYFNNQPVPNPFFGESLEVRLMPARNQDLNNNDNKDDEENLSQVSNYSSYSEAMSLVSVSSQIEPNALNAQRNRVRSRSISVIPFPSLELAQQKLQEHLSSFNGFQQQNLFETLETLSKLENSANELVLGILPDVPKESNLIDKLVYKHYRNLNTMELDSNNSLLMNNNLMQTGHGRFYSEFARLSNNLNNNNNNDNDLAIEEDYMDNRNNIPLMSSNLNNSRGPKLVNFAMDEETKNAVKTRKAEQTVYQVKDHPKFFKTEKDNTTLNEPIRKVFDMTQDEINNENAKQSSGVGNFSSSNI